MMSYCLFARRVHKQMGTRGKAACAAVLALFACWASPAIGLDGEVLINQKAANDGGITPADTPGFPITLNRSGKYKLVGNLKVPAGKDGIVVTAHNVTIDFNGFRMTGGAIGINAANRDGLTVMNGTISGTASTGIDARHFAVIQDMHVINSGLFGVKLRTIGRVLRNTISRSNSVNVYCAKGCLIARNVISGSATETGVGLFTTAGGHLVLGNVIADNSKFAIYAEGATAYADNTITGNGEFGGSSIIGSAFQAHPNYCNPACP